MPSRIILDDDPFGPEWYQSVASKKKRKKSRSKSATGHFAPTEPGKLGHRHAARHSKDSPASGTSAEAGLNVDSEQPTPEHPFPSFETKDGYVFICDSPSSPPVAELRKLRVDQEHEGTRSPYRGRQHKVASLSKKKKDLGGRRPSGALPSRSQRNTYLPVGSSGANRNDDGGGDEGSESGGDSGAGVDVGGQRPLLACPFYKHNSMRYMSCVRLRLTRVRDVKQHLNRRHRRPMHCPTCYDLFTDSAQWEQHIVARSCSRSQNALNIEGISESQGNALARRVNRSLDEANQWYSIWEILFPDSPRPPSPYIFNPFEEAFSMVESYWQGHGPDLVAELAGSTSGGDAQSTQVAQLSSRVIDTLLSRFRIRSQAVMDPNPSNPAYRAPVRRVPVPSALRPCPIEPSGSTLPQFRHKPHQLPPQDGPGMDMAGSPSYGNVNDADSHATILVQLGHGTSNEADAAPAPNMPSFPMDTMQASPYTPMTSMDAFQTCTEPFLASTPATLQGLGLTPQNPLSSTDDELLQMGAWQQTAEAFSMPQGDQYPMVPDGIPSQPHWEDAFGTADLGVFSKSRW